MIVLQNYTFNIFSSTCSRRYYLPFFVVLGQQKAHCVYFDLFDSTLNLFTFILRFDFFYSFKGFDLPSCVLDKRVVKGTDG